MQTDEFKQLVHDFSEAHRQLTAGNASLKDLRTRTKEMQAAILAHMQEHGVDELALTDARLVRKRAKKTEPLKKEHIHGELKKLVGDISADDAIASMNNRRLTEMQETLAVVKVGKSEQASTHASP